MTVKFCNQKKKDRDNQVQLFEGNWIWGFVLQIDISSKDKIEK